MSWCDGDGHPNGRLGICSQDRQEFSCANETHWSVMNYVKVECVMMMNVSRRVEFENNHRLFSIYTWFEQVEMHTSNLSHGSQVRFSLLVHSLWINTQLVPDAQTIQIYAVSIFFIIVVIRWVISHMKGRKLISSDGSESLSENVVHWKTSYPTQNQQLYTTTNLTTFTPQHPRGPFYVPKNTSLNQVLSFFLIMSKQSYANQLIIKCTY